MTTDELPGKVNETLEALGLNLEGGISSREKQSELVEKESDKGHILGSRPGSGPEILGRIERARDRARAIVAEEIRSAGEAGLDRGERPRARRPAAARRDADASFSQFRDQGATGSEDGADVAGPDGQALRRSDVDRTPENVGPKQPGFSGGSHPGAALGGVGRGGS